MNGPKGQKRPGDVVGCAVHVARIATGEIGEEEQTKAQNDGRKGGHIRASRLTPQRRIEIARSGARARWKKKKKVQA